MRKSHRIGRAGKKASPKKKTVKKTAPVTGVKALQTKVSKLAARVTHVEDYLAKASGG